MLSVLAVAVLGLSMTVVAGVANADGLRGPRHDSRGGQPPRGFHPPSRPQPPGGDNTLEARVVDGVQIYRCNDNAFAQFNVRATLEGGISHFFQSDLDQPGETASPVWAVDGGQVVGSAAQATPNGDGNIPLLSLTGTGSGSGPLSTVTRIQRLDTGGGVAPAGPCTDGQIASVPYQARYVFAS
jgi:hypothetical protein